MEINIKQNITADEPQKPVVPQFVADWYEKIKDEFDESIWEYLVNWDENEWDNLKEWFAKSHKNKAIVTLANMHQFGYEVEGYEVEKEKRYSVKVKVMDRINGCLAYNKNTENWFFGISGNSKNHRTHHTRKELEDADFGWVFDCEGIEIEEVE